VIVPRTQRVAVRCRAGAYAAWVPALRSSAVGWAKRSVPTILQRDYLL